MKKLLIITGTRPEVIKMQPVFLALSSLPGLEVKWCHSGQHDSLANQLFTFFQITPDVVLTRPEGQGLSDLVAGMMHSCSQIMRETHYDMLLVHGDTSTTLAAALAAFYQDIPIGHVEAGLRSGKARDPFPEENNRCLVSALATRHYPPTARALANLLLARVPESAICLTGNTVVDAQAAVVQRFSIFPTTSTQPRLLVTTHRRENWLRLEEVCQSLLELCRRFVTLEVVFPLHPNPQTRDQVLHWLSGHARIQLCAPLDYLALQRALASATLVLTDSAGIQEEAMGFRTPCLILRDSTERQETIDMGMAELVGTDRQRIQTAASAWLSGQRTLPRQMANPFGNGCAAQRIRQDIAQFLGLAV
jgi:UDP-N-acetylglucosamine 2-epimerase (non-hydrolysing)